MRLLRTGITWMIIWVGGLACVYGALDGRVGFLWALWSAMTYSYLIGRTAAKRMRFANWCDMVEAGMRRDHPELTSQFSQEEIDRNVRLVVVAIEAERKRLKREGKIR